MTDHETQTTSDERRATSDAPPSPPFRTFDERVGDIKHALAELPIPADDANRLFSALDELRADDHELNTQASSVAGNAYAAGAEARRLRRAMEMIVATGTMDGVLSAHGRCVQMCQIASGSLAPVKPAPTGEPQTVDLRESLAEAGDPVPVPDDRIHRTLTNSDGGGPRATRDEKRETRQPQMNADERRCTSDEGRATSTRP